MPEKVGLVRLESWSQGERDALGTYRDLESVYR